MDGVLPQELLEYVHHGREERNLEYKENLDWDDRGHQAKLVKAGAWHEQYPVRRRNRDWCQRRRHGSRFD